jgi:hypothetical protein
MSRTTPLFSIALAIMEERKWEVTRIIGSRNRVLFYHQAYFYTIYIFRLTAEKEEIIIINLVIC